MYQYYSNGCLTWEDGPSVLYTLLKRKTKNVLVIYDEHDKNKIPTQRQTLHKWLEIFPNFNEISAEEEFYMKKVQKILEDHDQEDWVILCSENSTLVNDMSKIGHPIPQPSQTYFGVA